MTPRPVVVLVHGTRMSRDFWRDYPALLPQVDVVRPDLPGHGARVGEEFTWERAVETVDSALPRDDRPTVVVGHSLGGYVAMAHAAAHPGRVAGLGLVGASAVPRGPGAALYRGFASAVPVLGPDRVAKVANAVMRALAGGREMPGVSADGAAYAAMPAAWAAVMAECGPHLLDGLDIPVLLLNGALDQLRIDARRYAGACSDVEVVTVPRATHFLPATHPAACAEHVTRLVVRATTGAAT